MEEGSQLLKRCPKCSKAFKRTNIPLLNTLLSSLVIKCVHFPNGCQEHIPYESYLKHALKCEYNKVICEGCQEMFLQKDIASHKRECEFISVRCEKCFTELRQIAFER